MSPTSSSLHRGFKSATQLAEVRLHDRDWPRQAQRGRGACLNEVVVVVVMLSGSGGGGGELVEVLRESLRQPAGRREGAAWLDIFRKAGHGMLLQAVVMRWTASSWFAMAWAGVDSLSSVTSSYNASDRALGVCHV